MEFRFDISPGELKIRRESNANHIEEEKVKDLPKLTLAPFTANTKICFENSVIGTTASQQLIVENPSAQDLKVIIKNMPPAEKHLHLTWEVRSIPAHDSVLLEITWTPDVIDSWRHTFIFQFGRCLKKDLPVTFKSVTNKKQINSKKTTSTKPSVHRTSVTSSINYKKTSGSYKTSNCSKKIMTYSEKENIIPVTISDSDEQFLDYDEVFLPSTDRSFTIEPIDNEIRRETYTCKASHCNGYNISVDSLDMPLGANNYCGTPSDTLSLKAKNRVFSPFCTSKFTQASALCSTITPYKRDVGNISTETYTKENHLDSASSLSERDLRNISTATYNLGSRLGSTSHLTERELGNISTETYIIENHPVCSLNESGLANVSTATYTKEKCLLSCCSPNDKCLGNLNSDTHIKGNHSTEVYSKSKFTSDTMNDLFQNESSPIFQKKNVWFSKSVISLHENGTDNIPSDVNFSPISFETPNIHQKNMSGLGVRTIIEANLWGSENVSGYTTTKDLITKPLKRKSDLNFEISPAKRAYVHNKKPIGTQNINWNKSKPPHKKVANYDVFYFDPYMVQSVYQNEAWMKRQETIFKNWLNALLMPPIELDTNIDGQQINVAKLWQESKQKLELAPLSKESVSSTYHTNHRLEVLRKSALELFKCEQVSEVLANTYQLIENQKLSIREDKNVHLNFGLQSQVTLLILNYNPLWLRIGLETLYNTVIPMSSNSDVMGLTNFLMQNFFKNSYFLQKFKSAHSPKYIVAIKKFILKKFFALVYFLDLAKTKTLIPHDPCLFRRNVPIKESREVVLGFSRELLSAVGDVTKVLRFSGYILNYKQKYIDEFDYSVSHLGSDLRDGVRLTRVMELILLKPGFTDCLRVPAVSRLQKIYNMKIVFDALADAKFEILGDISPKDIIDGHYEKTLSFLWQIIYKFQAPAMIQAAVKIMKWWRSLRIVVERKIMKKRKHLQCMAATKIQRWYKRHRLVLKINQLIPIINKILMDRLLNNSAVRIQAYFKMYIQQKHYLLIRKSALILQRFIRPYLKTKRIAKKYESALKIQTYVRMWINRRYFLNIRASVISMQQRYRAKILMLQQRSVFLQIKVAAIIVQRQFKANKLMRHQREKFLSMKAAVIILQLHFRAFILMKNEKRNYERIRNAVITIQKYVRGYQTMKMQFHQYQKVRNSVIVIQTKFKAYRLMKIEYNRFNLLKRAAKTVQSKYRANKLMKQEYQHYHSIRNATIIIQQKYRAYKLMKVENIKYVALKHACVYIQRQFRATKLCKLEEARYNNLRSVVISVQRQFRANKLMILYRNRFVNLRIATTKIQRKYRSTVLMRIEREKYAKFRHAAITIQRWYRCYKQMKSSRTKFLMLKSTTLFIQEQFRAHRSMKLEKERYQKLRSATICIQKHFKANHLMKVEKQKYSTLKNSVIAMQRRYKANKCMKVHLLQFNDLRKAVIKIQALFRANRVMRIERIKYLQLKKATIVCQAIFRANKIAQAENKLYQNYRNAVIKIQTFFRANQQMKMEKRTFIELKKATVIIQRRYRARIAMKKTLLTFRREKAATVVIQRAFRAHQLMKIDYTNYKNLKSAVIKIQQRFQASKAMKRERDRYLMLKKFSIVIQNKYRASKLMNNQRARYIVLKSATIYIQQKFRANQLMKKEICHYIKLREATILIQRMFRARRLRVAYTKYTSMKTATICIQRKLRATLLMKTDRAMFTKLRVAVVVCQTFYRAQIAMKTEYRKYQVLKSKVIFIQQLFRANRLMKIQSLRFKTLKKAAITIQTKFKANKAKQLQHLEYNNYRSIVIFIQRRFRSNRAMKIQGESFKKFKNAVITIQRNFRQNMNAKQERRRFLEKRNAAITIQRRWRLFLDLHAESLKLKRMQRKAAIKIQACWRGHIVQKNYPEIATIRKKLKKATNNALPENTLSQRRERAIQILIDHPTLLQVSRALDDLDFITRRCKDTLLGMSNDLPEHLYVTVTATNRSPAEMEVCTVATSILINFCKYPDTTDLAWKPSYMAAVISVLYHCCDKEDKLFPYLCTLIWLFAHNDNYKQYILSLPKFKHIIAKIEYLCLRKQKMVSLKSHCTPSYFRVLGKFYKPSLLPDWGFDYPHRPRTFINSVHALHSLLKILDYTS